MVFRLWLFSSFPGGKRDNETDATIFFTAVREMEEEVDGIHQRIEVIAGLRCPWEELQSISSDEYAVTPVVGWLGEIGGGELCPKSGESEEVFTIPLSYMLDDNL